MQVFDLSDVKPFEFVQYGLKCLEMLADLGDSCSKETREKMRVVVWALHTLAWSSLSHIGLQYIALPSLFGK